MSNKIQDILRAPIKHPQQCVTQRQQAADYIDDLEAKLKDTEQDYVNASIEAAEMRQQRDERAAALRAAHHLLVKDELRAARAVIRKALAKLDGDER